MNTLNITLSALRAEMLRAQFRRDGHAETHLSPVVSILEQLNASIPHNQQIESTLTAAHRAMLYCKIHDFAMLADLSADDYEQYIEATRHLDARIQSNPALHHDAETVTVAYSTLTNDWSVLWGYRG